MELKETFNTDPSSYDLLRPKYPKSLYDDIETFLKLDSSTNTLEVGIGTGQATQPILDKGCSVTAIELGQELAEFSRMKYESFESFKVINGDFESVELDDSTYDLVYAASSFHWIPIDLGLKKVLRLLKDGGMFAWISIQPGPSAEHIHIHEAIQDVYNDYRKYFEGNDVYTLEKIEDRINKKLSKRYETFKAYGFKDVKIKTYPGSRCFSAEEYIKLISTYSDHKIMPVEIRTVFLNRIKAAIDTHGGYFKLADTAMLCIGRK